MSVSDFERVWLVDDECVCGHPHREHSPSAPHACAAPLLALYACICERFRLPPKTPRVVPQ